jgi:hypothetical protein
MQIKQKKRNRSNCYALGIPVPNAVLYQAEPHPDYLIYFNFLASSHQLQADFPQPMDTALLLPVAN